MEPIFKQPLKYVQQNAVLRHMLFWLAYILYILINQGWGHRDDWNFSLSPTVLTEIPVSILIVYINLYFLMPRYYNDQKYLHYIALLIVVLIIGGLLNRFFSWWIWLPRERLADPRSDEPTNFWIIARIVKNAADIFPLVAATVVLRLVRNSYQHEKKLNEVEKEKFTAEMGMLKAQINPHFFFNTLNSIYALTLERSEKSPAVVLRLAELMRYMLYETGASKVLLKQEIAHLENYIGIEQMRFEDRLDLSFQYSGDITGKMIAPLLLLPFIENAFKHGLGETSGWITIDLKVTGNVLFLIVENSFRANLATGSAGMGLNNAKRRLELSYPGSYQLQTKQNEDLYSVSLTINL